MGRHQAPDASLPTGTDTATRPANLAVVPTNALVARAGVYRHRLANVNVWGPTIRAYLIAFAAHPDDEIGGLGAAPIRAYLAEITNLAALVESER